MTTTTPRRRYVYQFSAEVQELAREAGQAAIHAYLEENPKAEFLDLPCDQCGAGVGESCVWRRPGTRINPHHRARDHGTFRAWTERLRRAQDAGLRAEDKVLESSTP